MLEIQTVDISRSRPNRYTRSRVIEVVAEVCCVTWFDLCSHQRSRALTRMRQLAYYYLHGCADMSKRQVGLFMGGRDHTTIIYGIDCVRNCAHRYEPELTNIAIRLGITHPFPRE